MEHAADLSPSDIAQLTAEALNPDESTKFVDLKGKQIPIKLMAIKRERDFMRLIKPVLASLVDARQDEAAMVDLATEAVDKLAEAAYFIAQDVEGVTMEWIENNCSSVDLLPVIVAQIAKYRQQDMLGKLSRLFGQSA